MNCKKANKNLLSFLDENLSEPTQKAIKQHLTTCNACTQKLEDLKSIYTSIETEKNEFSPNPFLASVVWAKMQNKSNNHTAPVISMRKSMFVTLAAAGIALGITIGTLFNTWVSERNSYESSNNWTQIAEDYLPNEVFSPYDNLDTN